MSRLSKLIAIFVIAVVFTGCAAMSTTPVTGFIYTDVKAPITATSNNGASKEGRASAQSILGLIATGDASIQAAAKSAGITRIHSVDYHSTNILGIVATYTVIVRGE